jgi:uncharacterized protein (DUF1697 family)
MVVISLLRGVNVGAHNRIKMDALRAVYESLGLSSVQTYVQSGNVVFQAKNRNLIKLASQLEDAFEEKFKFRPAVFLRTADEMKQVVAANPFAKRKGIEPGKLLVNFLAVEPEASVREALGKIETDPEEMRIIGRQLYIYFPEGQGRSKLPWVRIDKALKAFGTGRNWNTVLKLLEMSGQSERR